MLVKRFIVKFIEEENQIFDEAFDCTSIISIFTNKDISTGSAVETFLTEAPEKTVPTEFPT